MRVIVLSQDGSWLGIDPSTSNQSENPNDVDVGESPVLERKEMQFRSILMGKTQPLPSWKSQAER